MKVNIKKIKELIKKSFSLKEDDKKRLILQVPALSDKQMKDLEKILLSEQNSISEINKSHEEDLEDLQSKYEKVKTDFNKKKILSAIRKIAREAKKKEEKKAEEILDQLNLL